jgi:hypothetical protein
MTRYLSSAILIGVLAIPSAARAQHQQGANTPSTGTAVSSAPAPAPAPAPSAPAPSTSSSGGGATSGQFAATPTSNDSGRRRGNVPATGTAVPRGTATGGSGGVIIEGSGFYPWGYAAGAIGAYDGYYGGYYGAYDPWYGWFPTYSPAAYRTDNSGALRLKVKPAAASVYVDGFYVGVVDDFDGAFQRLRLDRGPHHIEIRAQDYQPLSVDVMIQEDFTITYRGDLAKQ